MEEKLLVLFCQGVDKRLSQPAQGEAILPIHVVMVELDLCVFPYE
jgi:hypothetical protein